MPSWGELIERINDLKSANPYDLIRRDYLEQLHEHTGRDVILYSSGWTHLSILSTRSQIMEADTQGFMEALYGLDGGELDIILHSPGGSPGTTETIVNYLRLKYDDIRIFVPHAAMSAATLMCCAADEVVMGKHSSLGPIDPQITLDTPTGSRPVPAQAILQQFDQAKEELEDDPDSLSRWAPILRHYGPSLLAECEQAVGLSEELAKEWAEEYMLSGESDPESAAKDLAETLTDWTDFKSHSRHIHREEAVDYGFEITNLEDDQELQDLILTIYHITTQTHQNKNVVKIIENHNGNAYISVKEEPSENQAAASYEVPTPPGPPQDNVIESFDDYL